MPTLTRAHPSALLIKGSPLVVTMQPPDEECDPTSPKRLGLRPQTDILIEKGRIVAMGPQLTPPPGAEVVDASRWVVMPGLVDAHNHPLYGGNRARETVLKAQGMSYEDIAAQGGGIAMSVKCTRQASVDTLAESFVRHAEHALSLGVVLMEAKTGYGLNPKEEMRLLEALEKALLSGPRDRLPCVAPTLLAPHAASPDFHGLSNYIEALIQELPNFALAAKRLQGLGCLPMAADIFVERNYFTKEHAELWLGAVLQHGFDVHIHADEFSRSGGAEVAAALAKRLEQTPDRGRTQGRVLSIDHCQYATEADLTRLAQLGVAAVALPLTSFFSNIPYVDAKRFRSAGVRVAIASDFNPGSAPINNLWMAAHLALTRCGFSLPEVFAGVTLNAAWALGAEKSYGVLAEGRMAHLVAFEGSEPEDFFASPTGEHVRMVIHSSQQEVGAQ